jgi:hypothetical protein
VRDREPVGVRRRQCVIQLRSRTLVYTNLRSARRASAGAEPVGY